MVTFIRKSKKSKIPGSATNVIDRTGGGGSDSSSGNTPTGGGSSTQKKYTVTAPEQTLFPNAPSEIAKREASRLTGGSSTFVGPTEPTVSYLSPAERASIGFGNSSPSTRDFVGPPAPTIDISVPGDGGTFVENGQLFAIYKGEKIPITTGSPAGLGLIGPKGALGAMKTVSTATARAKLYSGGLEKILTSKEKLGVIPSVVRAGEVIINPKTAKLTQQILSRKFSIPVLAAVGSWAGAVFLGKWGQAEAPEPLSIVKTKFLIPNAMETGNWSLVREAEDIENELLDLEWWESAALWSPVSPLVGIPRKIKGGIAAAKVSQKLTQDLERQQQTGETEDEKWERLRQEQVDQEKANVDYYNQERKKMFDYEQEAKKQAQLETNKTNKKIMQDEAEFWRSERENQREKEEEDRKAIAEFWLAYRKAAQKAQEDNRPSKLNFGLL